MRDEHTAHDDRGLVPVIAPAELVLDWPAWACKAPTGVDGTDPDSRGGRMRIAEVLTTKGADVVSVPPDCDVAGLLRVLAERGIGAAVVSADGATVEGIVSERDVVRALAARGATVLQEPVLRICTVDVHTVGPDTTVEELMLIMTERRIRHVPVVTGGVLSGLVSIGDVVKRHMSALEDERSALSDYITAGG